MEKDVEELILEAIKTKKVTAKSIYEGLGMSQTGFNRMIKQRTTTAKNLLRISTILNMDLGELLQIKSGDDEGLPNNMMDLRKENEFLKNQINALTEIINNLTKKGDTKH